MEARIAAALVRYRLVLFVSGLLALLALAAGARDLWFEGSYRIFFSADDPYLVANDQIEAYIELKWEEVMRWETTPSPVEFDMYYSS